MSRAPSGESSRRSLAERVSGERMSWFASPADSQVHDDLGHVAKAQTRGVGLNIGMAILDHIIPGSGALTHRSPVA